MTRTVPAPGLREVAEVWWDIERDPVVAWDASGRTYWLTDESDASLRLHLVALTAPSAEPSVFAAVLAEGLASCDFPPTGVRASPPRVAATLRAAHRPERAVEG